MKKLLLLFIPLILFFGCEPAGESENNNGEGNNTTNQYIGSWTLYESYYNTGPNGVSSGNGYYNTNIENGESENKIIITTSWRPYIFTVDEEGILSGLTDNYTEEELIYNNLDSIQTFFIGSDSLYMYWRNGAKGGMGYIIIEITGNKVK